MNNIEYDEDNEEEEYLASINNMYQEERDALQAYFNTENIVNSEKVNEPTNYIYPGLKLLSDDLETCANNYESGKIHICAYYVNESIQKPFLQFILRKYGEEKNDLVTFPSFAYIKNFQTMNFCNLILAVMHKIYRVKRGMYEYKGFINKDNQFYVFYDFSPCFIAIHDLYRANDTWLVTMDEIINHKNVCNFPIDSAVSDFFTETKNIELSYLLDQNKNIIETPIVGYSTVSTNKLNFMLYFGVNETIEEYLPDPHYYFTNYQKAFKKAQETDESDKSGMVRFALFPGYMRLLQEKLPDKDSYDSVYIGDAVSGNPTWALTKNDQQCPLTGHYINKTVIEEQHYII